MIKIITYFILLNFLTACANKGSLDDSSKLKLQTLGTTPNRVTCNNMEAFGVNLSLVPKESDISIIKRRVKWAGKNTVTQFSPNESYKGFNQFIYFTTPVSNEVSWVMGIAHYETNEAADYSAKLYAEWYSKKMSLPINNRYKSFYVIDSDELHMMILSLKNTVRVSCEHTKTANKGLWEANPSVFKDFAPRDGS